MKFVLKIQGWFNIRKLKHPINSLKKINDMIISNIIEEALDKIQHLFIICKNLSKLGKEIFKLINGIC